MEQAGLLRLALVATVVAMVLGADYRVTTIVSRPFTMKKVGGEEFEGYIPDLLKEIEKITKDTYTLEKVKDDKYGARKENGEWEGMVGEVLRREADFAAAPLTITSTREEAVAFTKPFMTSGITMLMKRPETGIGKYANAVFLIFKPMTCGAWIMLLVAFLAVALALYLLNRFHPHEFKLRQKLQGKGSDVEAKRMNIRGSLWVSYRALNLQGVEFTPKSIASRLLFSFWLMFILFTISLYITALVTWWPATASGFTDLPVASMDDLSKQTSIGYGCVSGGSTEGFFKNSKVPVYERMYHYMSTEPDMMKKSNVDGVKAVQEGNGKYVFLMEGSSAKYVTQQKPCDLVTVGEPIKTIAYGLATTKDSGLKDKLNMAILQLSETGILETLHQRWWRHKTSCRQETNIVGVSASTKSNTEPNSVTATQLGGPFILLLIGFVIAAATAVAEVLYYKRRERLAAAAAEKGDEEAGAAEAGEEAEKPAEGEEAAAEGEAAAEETPVETETQEGGSRCSCINLPKITLPAFPLRRRGEASAADAEEGKALKEGEEKPDGGEEAKDGEEEKKDEEKKDDEPAKITTEIKSEEKKDEEKETKESEEKKD